MLETEQGKSVKRYIQSLLTDEGFRPELNDNDDIEFKVEGLEHFYEFDEQDPTYVRLLLPDFWAIDDQNELRVAYIAANHACERCKGVKVFVMGDTAVWASIEFFMIGPGALDAEQVNRQITTIRAGCYAFAQKMEEIQDAIADATAKPMHH